MLLDIRPYVHTKNPPAHLSNWGVLHAHLAQLDKAGKLTPEYVVRLLGIELATRKRLILATRLLGVYHRLAREENEKRLAAALGKP